MQHAELDEDLDDVVGYEARSISNLARSASEGEHAAWVELITRFRGVIVAGGRRDGLSAPEIDHLQQKTWLRLVENLDRIDPEQIGAWLAATAHAETRRILDRDAS